MTQVVGPAEQVAGDRERDRLAWNLPRTPTAGRLHGLPAPREPTAPNAHGIRPLTTPAPPRDVERAVLSTTGPDIAWEEFVAAYFPERRRHDLKAITAYAAYKHSHAASLAQAAGLKNTERIGATAASVEAWEDEGGALQ
jgi:hypothetical protein